MAEKTPEQKAAEKAAKTEKKRIKQVEKSEMVQLADAQKLEIRTLKEEMKALGLSDAAINAAIKAESQANKTEYTTAKATLKQPGQQSLKQQGQGHVRTASSTYDTASGAGLESVKRRDAAEALHDKYLMTDAAKPAPYTKTGITLNKVDKAIQNKEETGSYGPSMSDAIADANNKKQMPVFGKTFSMVGQLNNIMNKDPVGLSLDRLEGGAAGGYTDDEIARKMVIAKWVSGAETPFLSASMNRGMPGQGAGHWEYSIGVKPKSIKAVDGYENVYRVRIGDTKGEAKDYTTEYYIKQADGTYRNIMLDRYQFDPPDVDGGLGALGSIVGIVLSIANPLAGTALGSALGAVGTQAVYGAVSGALSSGDLSGAIKGALSAGIGSAVSSGALDLDSFVGDLSGTYNLSAEATTALKTGLTSAIKSGVSSAINGGDFSDILLSSAVGGVASGVGSYVDQNVQNWVDGDQNVVDAGNPSLAGDALSGAAGGAVTGGLLQLGTGGNLGEIGQGILVGGLAGGVGGAVGNLTGNQTIGNVAGNLTGGLLNNALNDSPSGSSGSSSGNSSGTTTGTTTQTDEFGNPVYSPFGAKYKNLNQGRDFAYWAGRRV
jgi:hypothetical protein